MIKFFDNCKVLDRPHFYLDLMAHYCSNTQNNLEKMSVIYLDNILGYMNHPDAKMSEKVNVAMHAIFKKVSKEHQFSLVPTIRAQIEKQCLVFVGDGSKLLQQPTQSLYKKRVEVLGIVRTDAGIKGLVEVVQAAIMHGSL
jgi:hypothetical protein